MAGHDIIVIGASAGGVEALSQIVRSLPPDLPAAIFIVLHIAPHGISVLPSILNRRSALRASHPEDGTEIEYGHVYIAPPDLHLLVERGHIHLARGPRENRHRPAVDPLFRSAARAYNRRVVGVILSGALDDGTAGLSAVKQRGGLAIVQDPEEALYDGMPRSAIENVEVDYVLPLKEIVSVLVKLASDNVEETNNPANPELAIETDMAQLDMAAVQSKDRPGQESPYSCPECGGVLWELTNSNLLRFRCRTGHAYSTESLLAEQSEAIEEAMWTALRALKEKSDLVQRMAEKAKKQNHPISALRFEKQIEEAETHAEVIRQVLLKNSDYTPPVDKVARQVMQQGENTKSDRDEEKRDRA